MHQYLVINQKIALKVFLKISKNKKPLPNLDKGFYHLFIRFIDNKFSINH